jgi:hypothetical protein
MADNYGKIMAQEIYRLPDDNAYRPGIFNIIEQYNGFCQYTAF